MFSFKDIISNFKDKWLILVIVVASSLFSSGYNYAVLKGQITTNTVDIAVVKQDTKEQLQEINRKLDWLTQYELEHHR